MRFLVSEIGEDEMILGFPWLAAFQPKIDWKNATLDESMQLLVIKTLGLNINEEVTRVRKAWVNEPKHGNTRRRGLCYKNRPSTRKEDVYISTNGGANAPKEEKTWDQIVPSQYHKWKKVFSEEEAKTISRTSAMGYCDRSYPEAPKTLDCKIYPLTLDEQGKLDDTSKKTWKRIYSTIKVTVLVTILLCWERRMENYDQWWTTGNSIPSQSRIDIPSH
jgi:hypothetical protein